MAIEHLKQYTWRKGQTGNAGGRPKNLERQVRELLGDDIVAMVYVQRCIALGVAPDAETMTSLGIELTEAQRKAIDSFPKVTARDAQKAFENLTDRGWGKPKQHVELDDRRGPAVPKKMQAMSDEQLRALATLDDDLDGLDDDELEDEDADEESGDGDPTTPH